LATRILTVCGADHNKLALDQLGQIGLTNFESVIEPVGRNTAPAIALACMMVERDEIVLVTPSDHFIKDEKRYEEAVKTAIDRARAGFLVTFGIPPNNPETGYGYIKISEEKVIKFKEKPDLETARKYLENGNYLWNSGIFCFMAGIFLDELRALDTPLFIACEKAFRSAHGKAPLVPSLDAMMEVPSNSIDYAVMEKSRNVVCIKCDFGWNDLGSFEALYNFLKDENGNAIQSPLGVKLVDSTRVLVIGKTKQITIIGVDDIFVVDTDDALVIGKRGSA
jgi:mannose-1-phosphate guanylyltransferase